MQQKDKILICIMAFWGAVLVLCIAEHFAVRALLIPIALTVLGYLVFLTLWRTDAPEAGKEKQQEQKKKGSINKK